ncbi:MAG: 2-C-methyl-D-erythritol 2,4-cyclodiphosphate synthase [Chlamydiia bacterium]
MSAQTLFPTIRTGIGREGHRFLPMESTKFCVIGGILFEDCPGLAADSDGDVVFHALCNAITSLTGVSILAGIAEDLCHKDGITDSQVYLEAALKTMGRQKITHVAIAIEGKRPDLQDRLSEMKTKIAAIMGLQPSQVGITVSSGDGLTDFGCGEGVQAFACVTTQENV